MNNQTAYDIEYGLHSNIPDCCVDFFVSIYVPLSIIDPAEWVAYKEDQYKAERFWGRVWSYVACPDCLDTGYHRKLHECSGKDCENLHVELQIKHGLREAEAAL